MCVYNICTGSATSVPAIFNSLPVASLVQMFRPECSSSFSHFSAKSPCSCAVSSRCPEFCGWRDLLSGFAAIRKCLFLLENRSLSFFSFLLSLHLFYQFQQANKEVTIWYGSKILAIASLRLSSVTDIPLSAPEIKRIFS